MCLLLFGVIYFIYLWNLGPENPRDFLHIDYSPSVFSREGKLLWVGLNKSDKWCLQVDLRKVSPYLVHATVALEDNRFWKHRGVDIFAVCRAVYQNLRYCRTVSGASTITMQLIKQYYKKSMDSPYRYEEEKYQFKLLQMVQALRLERSATKEEILQAYLNSVSYGGNLIGVESASWRYFGKTAEMLSIGECALLAGLPCSPEVYRPDRNETLSFQRIKYVLGRMKEEKYIGEEQYIRYSTKKLEIGFYQFPCHAQHWVESHKNLLNRESSIYTSINYDVQVQVEEILKKKVGQYSPDILVASAMVVDVSTGEILARVGGTSGNSRVPISYLDFCNIPRSPGSALKPFLYCLAMEKGYLFPEEALYDSEFDIGNYTPKNFDESYHGFVDATTSLRFSLNIPAVLIIQRLGTSPFLERLRRCGVALESSLNINNRQNLGIVLGNCEVRLEEMMQAYYCLANEGLFKPIHILKGEEQEDSFQVFDRGSTLVLYKMLEGKLQGELLKEAVRFSRSPTRVCWKTGTSSGRKDAWAFLFNKHYVVGVWMGNPQSNGSVKLVGGVSAYPTACDIFRALPDKATEEFPDFTDNELRQIEVCSLSGLPANPHCPFIKRTVVSTHMSLSRMCDVHYYDIQSGTVKERFPPQSKGWDLAKVGAVQGIGNMEKFCAELKILKPADNAKFVLDKKGLAHSIELQSSRDNMVTIHWYVDDHYLGNSSDNKSVWLELKHGKHKIYCLDETGEEDTVFIDVYSPEELAKVARKKE